MSEALQNVRPYRLREVRDRADQLAQHRAWHLFISYARVPDSAIAIQLRRYLMNLTRPWLGFSNLRVFLDREAMVPSLELPEQIAGILSASSALVLLACAASAKRPYVRNELARWQQERGGRPLIIVHTGGELNFLPLERGGHVDWATTTALDRSSFEREPVTSDTATTGRRASSKIGAAGAGGTGATNFQPATGILNRGDQ
ncbi:MAG: toll/interleukin-1 receptor domain-containing protein [Pseudonocardia sp.]|nr:toll/interleukin-1 receptor domain-containing protein [Pseudonocardia sp.]